MAIKIKKKKGVCEVKIDGELSIFVAGEIRDEFKDELFDDIENISRLEIDLSEVESIDTAGVQLLLLAEKEITGADKSFEIVCSSEPVTTVLDLYNLVSLKKEIHEQA